MPNLNPGILERLLGSLAGNVGWVGDKTIIPLLRGGKGLLGKTVRGVGHSAAEIPGALGGAVSGAAHGIGDAANWLRGGASRAVSRPAGKVPPAGTGLRRLASLPLAYYGGEMASAPWSSDDTMKKMRENYWGSVAADAGDTSANGADRWKDLLLTPGRAFRAGGEHSDVPNATHGDMDKLFHGLKSVPGQFQPGEGASNETQYGSRQAPLSNYQKAQQALAMQDEKARVENYKQMLAKEQPLLGHAQQSRNKFQGAFPNTAIPELQGVEGPSFPQLLGQGVAEGVGSSE